MTVAMTELLTESMTDGLVLVPVDGPAGPAGRPPVVRPVRSRAGGRRSPGPSAHPGRSAVTRSDRGRAHPPALFDRSEVFSAVPRGRRETTMGEDGAVVTARASAGGRAPARPETTTGVDTASPTVSPTASPTASPTVRRSARSIRSAAPVAPAALSLLADASLGLGRACAAGDPADRYAIAHLAALRGGAAVLAARARPTRGRQGSVWALMTKVAPEFDEWAAFFAAGSAKRQAVQAGLPAGVTAREADDLVRQVALFLSLVGESLRSPGGSSPH